MPKTRSTKPPKERIREWLDSRTHQEEPPPSLEEIREQLGWRLIPHNGAAPEVLE